VTARRSLLERAVRQDKLILSAGLLIIASLAWIYLLRMASAMRASADEVAMHAAMGMTMPGMEMAFGALFLMWAVMMVAMMLPSAAPVALLVLGTYRQRGGAAASVAGFAFVAGYLAVWSAFSAAAAGAQAWLQARALLSHDMATTSRMFAGVVLIGAGLYQWLSIKDACLSVCRSPIDFLTRHWREGILGAVSMGARHGTFCVGCCWALMSLLFVVGVMNLLWVAAISLYVLIEKRFATGPWLNRGAGIVLGVLGVWVLFNR
jgi:predicted metal-binding membrane protein